MSQSNGSGCLWVCQTSQCVEAAGHAHEITPHVILRFIGMELPFSSVGVEIQNVCSSDGISMESVVCAKCFPGQLLKMSIVQSSSAQYDC